MQNKKIKILLLAGFLYTTISPTFALCSLATGWYADGNIGYTTAYGKNYPRTSKTYTAGKAWNFAGGYKFNRFVALEVGYTRYMPTRLKNSLSQTMAYDNHYAVDVTSKLILPIQNIGLEVFAKLGIAGISSTIGSINQSAALVNLATFDTSNKTSTGLYYGLGAQYYFTPGISTILQYAQARGNNNTGNLGIGSIGLSLLF